MAFTDIALRRGQADTDTVDGLKLIELEPMMDTVNIGALPMVPQSRSPLLWIVESWIAEGFARSELLVKDGDEKVVTKKNGRPHDITAAWRRPFGGRGAFTRGFVHDWLNGLYYIRPMRRADRSIRQLKWIPSRHVTIPSNTRWGRNYWTYKPPNGTHAAWRRSDFLSGVWDIDPDNEYRGLSPMRKIDGIIRLDAAITQYVIDAFLRSGGKGLMFTVPTLADPRRFKTVEERAAYRAEVRDSIKDATTGEHRGDPLVTDGDTTVSEYGVDISELDVSSFWGYCHEIELGLFQIPPSSAGLRIGRDPTYANSRTWEAVAFERGLQPRFRDFISHVEEGLLTEDELDDGYHLEFKTADADRAALEDQLLRDKIVLDRVERGIMGIVEGRRKLGDIDDEGNEQLVMDLQQAQIIRLFGLTLQVPLESDDLASVIAEAARVGVAPQQMTPEAVGMTNQ